MNFLVLKSIELVNHRQVINYLNYDNKFLKFINLDSINKDPPYLPDENIKIENPFSLENWIEKNSNEIKKLGKKSLFSGNYQSNIVIYGGQDTQTIITQDFEAFIWQIVIDN